MALYNKKTKKLNVYAKNFKYIENDKLRPYLSKLTNFLTDNEWLKLSGEKYYDFEYTKKESQIDYKPLYVSWFSKGSWLFHEAFSIIDQELIYITVDYKNIFRINNKSSYSDLMSNDQYKSQLSKFNKKYIAVKRRNRLVPKRSKYAACETIEKEQYCEKETKFSFTNTKIKTKCKWNKKTKKCNYLPCTKEMKNNNKCEINYAYPYHNWDKVFEKYDGMAIYPMMTTEEMEKIQNHIAFLGWDVETLVLSNSKPIIHHHNLGTIRELLNLSKKDSDKKINYSKLVSKLIEKISEIRKSM